MQAIKEILQAALISRRFEQFFSGVEFKLSDTSPVMIKIHSCEHIQRSNGYRLVKHSIKTKIQASNEIYAYGFGESDSEILALQKSIAEGIERCIFKMIKVNRPELRNSSGWAAHLTKSKAQASARSELLERDASLLHWLSQTPMKQIQSASLPASIQKWVSRELSLAPRFNELKILVSHLGFAPVTATFIHDKNNFGFISQATSAHLDSSIEKALAETCRIADLSEKGLLNTNPSDQPSTPEDHAVYYSFRESVPHWIFGDVIHWKQAQLLWSEKSLTALAQAPTATYDDYQCGPLHISYCQSSQVQKLYFGSTETALAQGWINLERLKKVCGTGPLTLLPHFVP